MFRNITFLASLSLVFAGTLPNDGLTEFYGRIVNGVNTSIEAHPYQVSLQSISRGHICGGSIINEDTIVTAAHCVQSISTSQLRVRLGATNSQQGGELVAVRALKYHEGYNSKLSTNDVAVIKLATPVKQSTRLRYIQLAERTPQTGTPAVVTGWGSKCFLWCGSTPTSLQEVEVNIVTQSDCASSDYSYGSKITDSMVCAYGVKKDACQGDSGGPLVAQNQLVGVVSWGNGCAREGYPGVYCDVAYVRQWILDTAASL